MKENYNNEDNEKEEVEMKEAVETFEKIVESTIEEINKVADELEQMFGGYILQLIFHEVAPITRDVVDDVEFFMHEKYGGQLDKDLYLILHTMGGDADAAYHLGIRLQQYVGRERRLFIIIPRYAKSAGTLLACAADKILLTPIAELGPIDPQIYVPETGRWISAKAIRGSLREVIETCKSIGVADSKIIGELVRRIPIIELGHYDSILSHVKQITSDILRRRMFRGAEDEANKIAERLVTSYEYHGRVIHYEEAKSLGLQVEVLSSNHLEAVYRYYRAIRELFALIDELLRPMILLGLAEFPTEHIVEARKTKHGLIYIPSAKKLLRIESLL